MLGSIRTKCSILAAFVCGLLSNACDGDEEEGASCGWDAPYGSYACGSTDGPEPSGTAPIECPVNLVEGELCEVAGAPYVGCCGNDGAMWFCGGDPENGDRVVRVDCG